MTIGSTLLWLAGGALLLATLPLVVELTTLTFAALLPSKRKRVQFNDGADQIRMAVIVPAHNEEALVGRCVRSLKATRPSAVEVIVIAHNCADATASEASRAGARVLELNDPDQTGKGYALQHGVTTALAEGFEVVFVIDSDSVASLNLINEVRIAFAAGARAVQCRYEVLNVGASQRTKLMSLAFLAFNVVRPRGRSRLGLSAGIFGNGFGLHRSILEQIPFNARSLVEDLEYHVNLVRAGIRVKFLNEARVWGEMPGGDKGAATQRSRWEGGRLRMMRDWAPRLALGVMGGQIRLIEPLLDVTALPLALEVVLLLASLCLPLGWLRLYAAGAFVVVIVHLLAAAACGQDFWGSLRSVLNVPAYILWKLWMIPKIWRASRTNAEWIRTQRDPAH